MTEQEIKTIFKWAVQNSSRPLTDVEKELLKQAIDKATCIGDFMAIALTAATVN